MAAAHSNFRRVGYLLSRYPAVSHTFFLKEVLGLRQRGVMVEVASVNPPDRLRSELPPIEAEEADRTFYVKQFSLLKGMLRVLSVALQHPLAVLRGLAAALQLGGWDFKSRAFTFFYLAEALLVGDWMRRRSLAHLHVHFGGAVASVGMLTAKAWKISWSLTLHGPDEFFDESHFFLRQKIESASFVICISDFCRSQVARITPGVDDDRLETVRLGVDCASLRPLDTEDASARQSAGGSTRSVLKLACTGRMVPAKGHRVLLGALALLQESGVEFSCALIGDGPERLFLQEMAQRLRIANRVQFLGAMAHEPTLSALSQADVFVLASFAEGLPVALMEAMALGIPCISTTIAAIPELIHDRENGLLVPPANTAALYEALSRLAIDRELRLRLGGAARATVEAHYNLARNLNSLNEVWSRRLSRKTFGSD